MKTYVLLMSAVFPAYHSKAGEPTEFEEKILSGDKPHTIRGNIEYWRGIIREVQSGRAILSIRTWSGKPYRSKQREIKQITKEDKPSIERVFMTYSPHLGYEASVNGAELFGAIAREELAQKDGLNVWDFSEWFFKPGKVEEFSGVIIHFNDFKYNER